MALKKLRKHLKGQENEGVYDLNELPAVEQRISVYDAEQSCRENCLLRAADGRVAADYIYLYPPGIPLVTPGEVITERVISVILRWLENGLHVSGVQKDQTVRVVCRNKEKVKNRYGKIVLSDGEKRIRKRCHIQIFKKKIKSIGIKGNCAIHYQTYA